ncbi:WXG100 family type VII secretion target [Jatrophihabitans fulvus]
MSGYEVDPTELFAAQAVVTEEVTEARAELARLQAAADDLLGHGWRGQAASAFGRGWQEWSEGARSVIAGLEQMAQALGVTAREYESNELGITTDLRKIA